MKTAIIKSNGVRDSTEEKATNNWAAEYAKRLVEKEAAERKKADDNHASERATGIKYSHVKLSDNVNSTLGTGNATAATPYAVKQAYDKAIKSIRDTEKLRTDLNEEISDRQREYSVLDSRITTEKVVRETADTALQNNISSEVERLRAEDNILRKDISLLKSKSHVHSNMEILDDITSERVNRWDSNVDFTEYKAYVDKLCFGFINEFHNFYTAIGISHYDGGMFGMTQEDSMLDCGMFSDDITSNMDCGSFEPLVAADGVGAIVDGGLY